MKKKIKEPFLNIGTGKDHKIDWYAKMLMKLMKTNLKIVYDKKKPDGMPRKLLDISLAKKYGWRPNNDFNKGFEITLKNLLKSLNGNEKSNYNYQLLLNKKGYKYPLLENALEKKDLDKGIKVIRSGFITMSKYTAEFEKNLQKNLKRNMR